jgi:hypothetical protein
MSPFVEPKIIPFDITDATTSMQLPGLLHHSQTSKPLTVHVDLAYLMFPRNHPRYLSKLGVPRTVLGNTTSDRLGPSGPLHPDLYILPHHSGGRV